jgi:hypothetical protein
LRLGAVFRALGGISTLRKQPGGMQALIPRLTTGTWLRIQIPAPDQRTTYNKEDA